MHRALPVLVFVAGLLPSTFAPLLGAEWSPERAAQYLDARQKAWFAWKPAASPDGPCVSCHTGMTYLLARPALRRALGETQPTMFEKGLLDRLRANVGAKPEGALQGVETVFAALFLAQQDLGKVVGSETRRAFDQLWALQLDEGATKGAWQWYPVNLDPFRTFHRRLFRRFARGARDWNDARRLHPDARGTRAPFGAHRVLRDRGRRAASAPRSPGTALGFVQAAKRPARPVPKGVDRRDLRKTAGRRRLEHRIARAMDAASRRAALTRQQQLCHGFCDVRARTGGHRVFASRHVSRAGMAEVAPGPRIWNVARRFDEQALSGGFDASAVHAGRCNRLREPGAS